MKTEVFVILEYGKLIQGWDDWDWVEETSGYVFDDYDTARNWVLDWVKEYNKTIKTTVRDEFGKFIELDEPTLKETDPDTWDCFAVTIEILRIGEIDSMSIEATDRVYLS